jgi:hypothetical protein
VQGHPLFNQHIKSIAMGYYGVSSDFVEKTRPYTLWRILTENPPVVVRQYAIFVTRYFSEIGGVALLLGGAMLAKRHEGRAWLLLAVPAAGLTMGLAAKFYTDRAILFQLVLWYVVIGRVLAHLWHEGTGPWRIERAVAVVLALTIVFASVLEAGRVWSRMATLRDRNVQVTALLRAAGVQSSREVFSTHLSFYLADAPDGGPFYPHDTWLLWDQHYAAAFPHAYLSTRASLAAFVERHGIRFLLLGPLTADLSTDVYDAQRRGDLGPGFTLIKGWGDLFLFAYEPAAAATGQSSAR